MEQSADGCATSPSTSSRTSSFTMIIMFAPRDGGRADLKLREAGAAAWLRETLAPGARMAGSARVVVDGAPRELSRVIGRISTKHPEREVALVHLPQPHHHVLILAQYPEAAREQVTPSLHALLGTVQITTPGATPTSAAQTAPGSAPAAGPRPDAP